MYDGFVTGGSLNYIINYQNVYDAIKDHYCIVPTACVKQC